MKCHICNTDNTKNSCDHYNIDKSRLKIKSNIIVKRENVKDYQKVFINRQIWGIVDGGVYCCDNLFYSFSQITAVLS